MSDISVGVLLQARERARRSPSLSRALATASAVQLGLAEDEEEAGSQVRRLTLHEVVAELDGLGFRALRPHRYAMYYRHWPGRGVRVLSKPGLFLLATAAFRVVNRIAGRFGDKLTVQAVRRD